MHVIKKNRGFLLLRVIVVLKSYVQLYLRP